MSAPGYCDVSQLPSVILVFELVPLPGYETNMLAETLRERCA